MPESVRKQLIVQLLEKGGLTIKEISERADCTTGYVYNIRTEWMLSEAQKGAVKMRELSKQMDFIKSEPKPFSDDWQPKWWQMLLMGIGGAGAYALTRLYDKFTDGSEPEPEFDPKTKQKASNKIKKSELKEYALRIPYSIESGLGVQHRKAKLDVELKLI